MKKILSFVMAAVMVAVMLPAVVSAAEITAPAGSLNEIVASAADGDTIVLAEGTYTLTSGTSNKNLTFKGVGDNTDVVINFTNAVALSGCDLAFENLTLSWPNNNYIGLQHTSTITYTDCVIKGQPFLYADKETFTNCTFEQISANAYNVWTYGADEVIFDNCTFNCVGKSVLVYAEEYGPSSVITFKDCVFNASAPVEDKAAIEIDSSLIPGEYDITIENCEANGFAEGSKSGNTLWNVKKAKEDLPDGLGENTVTVDEATVIDPVAAIGIAKFATLEAALNTVAFEDLGDVTITLLKDIDEVVTVLQKKGTNLVIDGKIDDENNVTYTGTIKVDGKLFAEDTLVIKNIDFATDEAAHDFIDLTLDRTGTQIHKYAHNVTIESCTFTGNDAQTAVRPVVINQNSNITIKNCKAEKVHNLVQNNNQVCGLTIEDCVVNAKCGVNLGKNAGDSQKNPYQITVKNCEFDVPDGNYVIQYRSPMNTAADPLVIENITVKDKDGYTFLGWYDLTSESDFDINNIDATKEFEIIAKYHICEAGTEYVYDDANHWNECTGEDCEEIFNVEPHTFGEYDANGKRICTVCGAEEKCGHSFTNWERDGYKNVRECTVCGVKETKALTKAQKAADSVKGYVMARSRLPYYVAIDADETVIITNNTSKNRTIDDKGTSAAYYFMADVKYSFVAADGYKIVAVYIDGVAVEDPANVKIRHIKDDHVIKVVTEPVAE